MPLPLRTRKRAASSDANWRSSKKARHSNTKTYAKSNRWRAQVGGNGLRNFFNPPRSIIPAFGGPFGQVFETELNYAEYFQLDPSSVSNTSYIFRANGLYDPNFTSTGHQPHGFDQLSVIYENYQVVASAIEVVCWPQTDSTLLVNGTGSITLPLYKGTLSICVRDTNASIASLGGTVADILERPGMKTTFFQSGNECVKLRHNFSMKQFYGRARGTDDNDVTGTANSDPSDQVFYHIIMCPADGSQNLASHTLNARIKYKVRFFNPKNLATSN